MSMPLWIAFGTSLLLASLFPVFMCTHLGPRHGMLAVMNNPAFSLFLLAVFPAAVGLFFSVFKRLDGVPSVAQVAIIATCLIAAVAIVYLDAIEQRWPVAPYQIKTGDTLVEVDESIRLNADSSEEKRKAYTEALKPQDKEFVSFADFRSRASLAAWWEIVLNAIVGLFVGLLFAYLILVMWHYVAKGIVTKDITQARTTLIVVIALLVTWFPMRLYSEWYLNYYSFPSQFQYQAFVVLAILALVCIVVACLLFQTPGPEKVIAISCAVASASAALIGILKPNWSTQIAKQYERLAPLGKLVVGIIFLFGGLAVVMRMSAL